MKSLRKSTTAIVIVLHAIKFFLDRYSCNIIRYDEHEDDHHRRHRHHIQQSDT